MTWLRKTLVAAVRRPLAVLIALAVVGSTVTALAAVTPSVNWTSKEDFENNAATAVVPTTRLNIDTSSSPGDLKIGLSKEMVSPATVTYLPTFNKVYTTGADRTSLAVIDATTKALIRKIALPGPAAGVVFNSANNKLYIGQANDNKVTVLDVATDTVLRTLSVGSTGSGANASAYNPINNKVYIANVADQTVTILDGATDAVLGNPVPVTAGATTASFDAPGNVLYLTSKFNHYVTVIDGASDQVLQDVQVDPILSLLGGNQPGNVGLRAVAAAAGIASADNMELSWNADRLLPSQNIQFQVRTASDLSGLDAASYQGPDGTADTWYDLSTTGASTVTESDGTETTTVLLGVPFAQATELQLKLAYDGITSPVLHQVGLIYDVTISATAGNGGSISPSGAVRVPYGHNQSFSITPDLGYHIADVVVDGVSQGAVASYTFSNVTANHSIAASFAINTYTITATAGLGGSISPASAVVSHGGSQGFTITPDTGYHVANVTVDGVSQGALTGYTFNNVTANHSIAASFAINTYTITATAGPGGSIAPASALVNHGASQGFAITPDQGYLIADVAVDGVSQGALSSYLFSNVTSDHVISASFVKRSYTITASAGLGGSISPSGAVSVSYGDDITFSFTPNSGCLVAGIKVDGVAVAVANSYTFSAVSGNHSISVSFTPSPTASLVQVWSVEPTFAGSSTEGNGGAPDTAGNFYYSKYYDPSYVIRLNSAGVVDWTSTTANSGGGQVATDNLGNVYSQNANGYLHKFTPPATAAVWSIKLPGSVSSSGAWAVMADNKGYLYVSMRMNLTNYPYKLFKVRTSDGVVVWSALTTLTSRTSGLVVDSQGKIYVTASPYTTIYKYDPAVGTSPVATFPVAGASYLAIDSADKLYVAGTTLAKMDTDGNTLWSVTPNPATPTSVATDGVNVYIGYDKYLSRYDAATGGLKQTINNVPENAYGASSWVSTDGYGQVYLHSTYNSWLLGPVTKYILQ